MCKGIVCNSLSWSGLSLLFQIEQFTEKVFPSQTPGPKVVSSVEQERLEQLAREEMEENYYLFGSAILTFVVIILIMVRHFPVCATTTNRLTGICWLDSWCKIRPCLEADANLPEKTIILSKNQR